MITVTFCGHADVWGEASLREWLTKTVEQLIERGADLFYLGGYGGFDGIAASVVREQKKAHPNIQSVLVLPYLDRKVDSTGYDRTTYPPLENVPRRFAISKRNEWMVDVSDVVVGYVTHSWGGASKTLEYARRKKKKIISYAEDQESQ